MDTQGNYQGVTAVVPAYNEEARIGKVLEILTTHPVIDEVVVIDDGSTDGTGEVAEGYPVRYLKNKSNMGKGFSMDKGVAAAKGDVIFFCDADIVGLKHEHIGDMIGPVVKDEVDMFIATRDRTGNHLPFAADFFPVGGERAITKKLWQRLPKFFKENFRVETGLNLYAKYFGKGFRTKIFKGLGQTMKEKKYSLFTAAYQRFRLNVDLIHSMWRLLFVDSIKLLTKGKIETDKFLLMWGTSFFRNLIISVALIVTWPFYMIISPLISRSATNRY